MVAGRSRQLLVPIVREHHPQYGVVEVTPETVARMAENVRRQVKTYHGRLPVTIDHDTKQGAAGWITGVETDSAGLWGEIEWNSRGVQAIRNQEFPFVSPEWRSRWTDARTGETHRDVFEGAGLVVRPQFRDLPPATLQHFDEAEEPTVWVFWEADGPEDDMRDKTDERDEAEAEAEVTASAETEAGTPAGEAEATEPDVDAAAVEGESLAFRELREVKAEVAELKRDRARLQFREEAGGLTFGEGGRQRLVPHSRDALAEFLAELPEALASRGMKLFGQLRFYEPGERGFSGAEPAADAGKRVFSEEEKSVAQQFGQPVETMFGQEVS